MFDDIHMPPPPVWDSVCPVDMNVSELSQKEFLKLINPNSERIGKEYSTNIYILFRSYYFLNKLHNNYCRFDRFL